MFFCVCFRKNFVIDFCPFLFGFLQKGYNFDGFVVYLANFFLLMLHLRRRAENGHVIKTPKFRNRTFEYENVFLAKLRRSFS